MASPQILKTHQKNSASYACHRRLGSARPIPQLYQRIRRRAGGGRYAFFMLHTTGIAAAVTVTFVIWFTIVVLALGSTLWPLLAGVH